MTVSVATLISVALASSFPVYGNPLKMYLLRRQQQEKFNSEFVRLIAHKLYEFAACFARQKLFINRYTTVGHKSFLAIIDEGVPNVRCNGELILRKSLSSFGFYVKMEVFQILQKAITRHCL